MDNLRVAYEWKQVDYEFPTPEARQEAIDSREFIPENNLPLGLEVHGDRIFVTVPRWKSGVAASLTYFYLNESTNSPILKPYPNWEAHMLPKNSGGEPPEIVSPFRIRADKCGRLWVLDTGIVELLGDTKAYKKTQVLVYDLHNDSLLRRFDIPKNQLKEDSFFATLAVEDEDCDDSYAYLADLGSAGLVVYSWKTKLSWRINHHYFNIDPTAGEFNVSGIHFQWTDHLFGMALSARGSNGFSTLYFHPMVSTNEFSVSTEYLRDPKIAEENFHNFKLLGSRGPNAQSSVSFLDKKSSVLFYALVNLNAIACWRTTNPTYNMESQGRVYMSNVTMVFPNDIKVDADGNLWVLSDRLPQFMYSKLNENEVNFRILTASVQDAIRGTACDSKLVVQNVPGRMKPTPQPPMDGGQSGAPNMVHLTMPFLLLLPFALFRF
ncbi:yellow-b [Carabus blaptoides fortunei]